MKTEPDDLPRFVAELYYVEEMSQAEIADLLNVNRSSVSRLLSRAREQGIVQIKVEPYEPRNRELEAQLTSRYDLRHAIVIKSFEGITDEHRRRLIGHFAASLVPQLIDSETALGIGGGRTLSEVARRVRPLENAEGVTVVQLVGNTGPDTKAADATEVTRVLAQRLGVKTFYHLNVPALAPDASYRDALQAHQDIRMVFQLFGSLEIALVGVGSITDTLWLDRGWFSPSDIETLQQQGAVGEICGRFFNIQGKQCATEYRERVISIDLGELRDKEQVVGIAGGQAKVEAIRAALDGGLINGLVSDDLTVEAVLATT